MSARSCQEGCQEGWASWANQEDWASWAIQEGCQEGWASWASLGVLEKAHFLDLKT